VKFNIVSFSPALLALLALQGSPDRARTRQGKVLFALLTFFCKQFLRKIL
jgi:hypothetical protein